MCKKIKMLDCFAGIGGFHIGVEEACKELGIKFECVGAIEFNKHSRETYSANFPDTPLLGIGLTKTVNRVKRDKKTNKQTHITKTVKCDGDITKIDLATLPKHNLLVGGFPCQPFSQSGNAHITNKGQLIDTDNKTHLYQYLINILSLHKPTNFIFENVEGLTRIMYGKVKLLDYIISLIPKNYKVKVVELSPHEIGIPQIRKRIFIVGSKKSVKVNIKKKKCPPLSSILDDIVDASYLLSVLWNGHNLIKQPTKTKIEALIENLEERNSKYPTATTNPCLKTVLASEINGDTPNGRSRQRDRAYHVNGMCPTLNCTDRKIVYHKNVFRAITPKECLRLQGFPDTFIISNNKNVVYTQLGNAVCTKVIKEIVQCVL